jgi:phosphoglycolate phosphatase-like HAD superfamily hydrolase
LPALGYADLFMNTRVSEDDKVNALLERAKAVYGLPAISLVTCDDVKETKPNPEGLNKALKELNVKPSEAIMVGDLDVDIEAAKKAGVAPVGIAHGFGTPADLMAAGALKVVDDLNALVALVEAHNNGTEKLV